MTSPIVICALSYIMGISLSPLINITYFALFSVCLILATAITRIFFKYRTMPLVLAAIMLVFGSARYNIEIQNNLFKSFPEKYVEIEGVVSSLPKISQSKYKYLYEVDLNSVKYIDGAYATNAKILLGSENELDFGDIITARGFLTEFSNESNEFEFNYRRYFKSRGILCRLTALELTKNGTAKSLSPIFWAGKARYRIYKNMESVLDSDDFAFGCAVFFGDKSHFERPYRTLLIRTGVFRALYSPFSHISVMLMIAALLFRRDKKRRTFLFAVLLILYLIFVNNSSLALKACITAGLIILADRVKGYSDKLGTVAFVAFLLTLINPLLCFDAGFMMSVISSAVLCLSYKPIYKALSRSRFMRKHRLASPLAVWASLSFGTLPFAAYYFNGMSLYSILLFPFILPFAAILIVLTPILCMGGAGTIVLPVYSGVIAVLRALPEAISRLPFYYIMLPRPSGLKIVFYCLLWWVFLRALKSEFKTPLTKLILTAMAGIFVCIAIDFNITSLALYFINVGQGDAAVLHTGIGETVLIDGGGASDYEQSYNVGESIFLPYLVSHGFTHIDAAIVSHYHKDHVEGIIAAAENLKINTLILPDSMPESKYRKKLEELAEKRKIKIEYIGLGDEIRFRSGLTFNVIAPHPALIDKDNENDTSLVIKVSYGDFSALFTGDFEAEEDLDAPQNIDVLKVGHHGSEDANDFDFLHTANPRLAIISVGNHNRYGLPSKAVVTELENMGVTLLRTDKLGDIRLTTDKKGNIKYNSLIGGINHAAKRR